MGTTPNIVTQVVDDVPADEFSRMIEEIVSFDDGADLKQGMVFVETTRRVAAVTGLTFAPARQLCKEMASNRVMREYLQMKATPADPAPAL